MNSEYKLIQYSAMAISFLFLKEADAEAVYTNIDPDTILNDNLEVIRIDMDNNGSYDFAFLKFTGTGYTYWSEEYSYFYYLHASPQISGNAIAGLKSVIDPSYGGFTLYYPYALLEGDLIDEELDFQNDFYQVLAFSHHSEDGGGDNGGLWFPEITSHFLGVRFIDGDNCIHYGWIRCDVKPGVDTLIIKDYAFESKCDVGILAGDTLGDTKTFAIVENTLSGVTVYSFNSDVFVNIESLRDNYQIVITDLNGKIIYNNILIETTNKIILDDYSIGYYFVKIVTGNKQFTKKIFIN